MIKYLVWRDAPQKGGNHVSEIFEQIDCGVNVQSIIETDDCRVMRLSDSSGDGTMTLYQVFPGVFLMYNDFHMSNAYPVFRRIWNFCVSITAGRGGLTGGR